MRREGLSGGGGDGVRAAFVFVGRWIFEGGLSWHCVCKAAVAKLQRFVLGGWVRRWGRRVGLR